MYSISLPGVSLQLLSAVVAEHSFSHLDIRGGARGFGLSECDPGDGIGRHMFEELVCPVGGVSSDWLLSELACASRSDSVVQRARFYSWTERLEAAWSRVLGDDPSRLRVAELPRLSRVPTLLELHHPDWFSPVGFEKFCGFRESGGLDGVLLDSEQLMQGVQSHGDAALDAAQKYLGYVGAVHLNSPHDETDWELQSEVVSLLAMNVPTSVPVSIELSGGDRTLGTAVSRLLSARAMWSRLRVAVV